MKVIIDIPEEKYNTIKNKMYCGIYDAEVYEAIANGTPLPKGHGRLMILSEDKLKENQINLDFSCQKWISEVGLSNATMVIIEADKESEIHCNCTDAEIAKSFIEDVEAVKDLLPQENEG